jgi:signal transduction histidine kinase
LELADSPPYLTILDGDVLPVIAILLTAFLLSMFLLVIERTHRIFGPVESMKKMVSELENGNYSTRVHLRKDDDFQVIGNKLNLLAETLQKKNDCPKT